MSYPPEDQTQDIGVRPPRDTKRLSIDSLASAGGIGRDDGMVWFVPRSFPGDVVDAEVDRRHRGYVQGRLARLVEPSPQRREPPCPIQGRCGGCPWMPLEPGAQEHWKRSLVVDALERIGGLQAPQVEPLVRPSPEGAWRNKVEFALGRGGDGEPVVGLFGADPEPGWIDVPRCPVQHPEADAVLARARELLLDPDRPWSRVFGSRDPVRLVLRRSSHTGRVLVAVRETTRRFPELRRFADELMDPLPAISGVVRLAARPGRRGAVRAFAVRGRTWLEEKFGQLTFRVPAASFAQVNTEIAGRLTELVAECAGPEGGGRVLDLYSGAGLFGLHLAQRGARVTLCEADRGAVASGRAAARVHGLRAKFVRDDAVHFLDQVAGSRGGFDLVVADPPRAGLGAPVVTAVAAVAPRRWVIVSCNPATLARDVRSAVALGYRVERVVPLDPFPETSHVETVVALTR